MEIHWKYFITLLWFSYLFLSGLLLFIRGFLLSREVLPQRATCKSTDFICSSSVQNDTNLFNSVQDSCSEKFISESDLWCPQNVLRNESDVPEECQLTCRSTKTKVVLIIIDALKYDFAYFDENIAENDTLPYQNKLTVMYDLLRMEPNHTRLFKFIADPPTTTMQRLKGLTTGSLPTFIDIGSNFATPEINEDNILDQLRSQNRTIVFMGDDTWSGLYPGRYIREYSYPSFNVWDLDTVDNGIMNHLLPELVKKDWNLLIAHFLGVDHCGHRYGPSHLEMSRKLNEMNDMIKSVVDTIDDNTMLFVVGDHGMTSTGDHGGDSDAEITAAMFVFSPKPLLSENIIPHSQTVNQVDLVPTLSAVLGVPIPYGNLGSVVLEALPSLNEGKNELLDWKFALKFLWENVRQTMVYLRQYSKETNQFSPEKLDELETNFTVVKDNVCSVSSLKDFVKFYSQAKFYLSKARQLCEEVWVQFDPILIANGLILTFVSVCFILLLVDGISGDHLRDIVSGSFLLIVFSGLILTAAGTAVIYFLGIISNLEVSIYHTTGVVSMGMIASVIYQSWAEVVNHCQNIIKVNDWPSIIGRILLLFSLCGLFSNSYVVEEASVISYFLLTMAWLLVYHFKPSKLEHLGRTKLSEKQSPAWYNKTLLSPLRMKLIMFAIFFSILVRLSQYFWMCREEQVGCESYANLKAHKLVNLISVRYCNSQSLFTLICLAMFVTVIRIWLRSCGNLVGFSPTVTLSRYGPTVIVVCTGGFWVLQSLPKDTKSKLFLPWQIQFLPWIVYFIVSVTFLTMFIQPLSIYVVPKKKESVTVPLYGQTNIIPHLFNQMKEMMQGQSKLYVGGGDENIPKDLPIVYGLATVYSSVFINVGAFICLLVALLLGEMLAPSVVLMCVVATVFLTILSALHYEDSLYPGQLFYVPWSSVVCWGFVTVYFFYGTGHNPTFPSIPWEAAFVGTGGQFSNNFVPALLVCLNTFVSQVLLSLMLPILVVAPFTLHVMFPKILPSAVKDGLKSKDLKRGELYLYERDDLLYQGMFILCTRYVLFFGFRIFASMLAATVHCRHLMVWKIFAPKLIFEGLGLFAILICVPISYFIVIRVTTQIERLLTQLNNKGR